MRKISIIFVICGVIMIALGISLGASTCMYWDGNGLHLTESTPRVTQALGAFKNIEVSTRDTEIEIIYGDEFSIEYYQGARNPVVRLEGDRLSITQESTGFYINFGFTFYRTDTIKITLPHGAGLESCNIGVDNGQVKIVGQSAEKLTVKVDNGRVVFSQIDSTYADISCSNGSLEMHETNAGFLGAALENGNISGSNITASNFKLSLDNGRVGIQSVKLESGTIEVENGSITVDGDVKNADIRVDNGLVRLTLAQRSTYYRLFSQNGMVTFDKVRRGGFWESGNPSSSNAIRVECNNGSVTVNTQ